MKRKHLLFKEAVCKNSISLTKLFVFGMNLRVRPRFNIFSSRSRSRKIRISSILKFFVYCCHSDIDLTENCILTNFNS